MVVRCRMEPSIRHYHSGLNSGLAWLGSLLTFYIHLTVSEEDRLALPLKDQLDILYERYDEAARSRDNSFRARSLGKGRPDPAPSPQ